MVSFFKQKRLSCITYTLFGMLFQCSQIVCPRLRCPKIERDKNVRLYISSTDRLTPLVNRLLYGIIIFQTKTTFLQDLHIVWYVISMFTNRLYEITVSENGTGQKCYRILTISDARTTEN